MSAHMNTPSEKCGTAMAVPAVLVATALAALLLMVWYFQWKSCQDPLGKFFSCQQLRGVTNDNPSVHQFSELLKSQQTAICTVCMHYEVAMLPACMLRMHSCTYHSFLTFQVWVTDIHVHTEVSTNTEINREKYAYMYVHIQRYTRTQRCVYRGIYMMRYTERSVHT